LFLDNEAPAAGTTVALARLCTALIEVLTFPLSLLCDEAVPTRANVKTLRQHTTVKILRFIWPPSF
jgi:hypothetical protein